MKKTILLLLFPVFTIAQSYDAAVYFQNTVRSYYDLVPLHLNLTKVFIGFQHRQCIIIQITL